MIDNTDIVTDSEPVVLSREVCDVDVLDTHVEDLVSESVQLEAKPFPQHWTAVRLMTCRLQFSRDDVASIHRIRTPENRWALFVPLRAPSGVRWDGHAIGPITHIVCPPASEGFVFDPGGAEFGVVSFTRGAAPEVVDAATSALGATSAYRILRPRRSDASALVATLVDLRDTMEFRSDTISSSLIAHADALVRRRLCQCLRGSVANDDKRDTSQARTRIVRRAERFVREHVGETVSIAQLSSIAGVSERSLRNAFYHVFMTGPKRYLKIWGLHQVRRSLRRVLDHRATVTTIAMEHGFYELGRFAKEYRALFGEAPSQTLHRARSGSGPLAGQLRAAG
jgi:AraC-like DNA-binding protein